MNIHEQNISDLTLTTHGIRANVLLFVDDLTFVCMSFDDACTLDDAFNQKYITKMDNPPNDKWHLHIFNTSNPYQ